MDCITELLSIVASFPDLFVCKLKVKSYFLCHPACLMQVKGEKNVWLNARDGRGAGGAGASAPPIILEKKFHLKNYCFTAFIDMRQLMKTFASERCNTR